MLAAVHVAGAMVDGARANDIAALDPDAFDVPFLTRIGLLSELPSWQAAADAYLNSLENGARGKGARLKAAG